MDWLFNLIVVTIVLIGACAALTFSCAWNNGGKFYIGNNGGRRKSWLERLLDGFEVLRKM